MLRVDGFQGFKKHGAFFADCLTLIASISAAQIKPIKAREHHVQNLSVPHVRTICGALCLCRTEAGSCQLVLDRINGGNYDYVFHLYYLIRLLRIKVLAVFSQ